MKGSRKGFMVSQIIVAVVVLSIVTALAVSSYTDWVAKQDENRILMDVMNLETNLILLDKANKVDSIKDKKVSKDYILNSDVIYGFKGEVVKGDSNVLLEAGELYEVQTVYIRDTLKSSLRGSFAFNDDLRVVYFENNKK